MEKDYTSTQVAEILKVSRQTIHTLYKQGRFPNAYKVNPFTASKLRFPKKDVDRIIQLRKAK
jgi:predicted DNA-binding transcriptional regulator AlpA